MSNVINISGKEYSRRPEIEAEARAWIITLDGSPATDELAEFQAWLQSNPQHRQIFDQTVATWNAMDRLSEVYFNRFENQPRAGSTRRSISPLRNYTVGAILAGLFLFAGVITLFLYPNIDNGVTQADGISMAYSTAIGEIKTVSLPDGSKLLLNSNTKIDISFNEAARLVHLGEGEAYFDVSHAIDKPFIVYAGKYVVKATGTAFSVEILGGELDVLVTEGRVEVATLQSPVTGNEQPDSSRIADADSLVPLMQGQRIILNEHTDMLESIQRVAPESIKKNLAWRDGMLMFDNDPLDFVIAEINRYTKVKIMITDSTIRDMRFGGYFRIGDVPVILATMEENYGLKVDRIADNLVYLSLKQDID